MRHLIAGLVPFLILSLYGSGQTANAATVSSTDVSAAEVTELTQAAAASVITLKAFSKAKEEQAQANRAQVNAQLAEVQNELARVETTVNELMAKIDRQSDLEDSTRSTIVKMNDADLKIRELLAAGSVTELKFAKETQSAITLIDAVVTAMGKLLAEAEDQIKKLAQQIDQIRQLKKVLHAALEKLKATQQKMKELLALLLEETNQDLDAEKASGCFARISSNKDYAAKLIAAARSNVNNPSGLGQFLKQDSPGSDIDVREVRDPNGLIVIFRLGRLTHCISTKQQCGGKPHTVIP